MRAVVFDFYGTLAAATVDEGVGVVLRKFGYEWNPGLSERWSIDRLDGSSHRRHSRDAGAYRQWRTRRRVRYLSELGVNPLDLAAVIGAIGDWEQSLRVECYPEVLDTLRVLIDAGIKIGVCSNWDWHLQPLLDHAGLSELVDSAVWSARAGARKPHPRAYYAALRALGAQPDRAVFVGDSWEADVAGPARIGMRSFHIHRAEGSCPVGPGHECLRSLSGVLGLLR